MYKLSDIIGKTVIGTFEAKNVGTLMNALFDRGLNKIRWFEALSDDETDAERTYFEPSAVSAMADDAIMLKNCGKLTGRFSLAPVFVSAPVNLPVYSPFGKALGRVTDITLDGFSVTEINVGELAFSPDAVLSSSDDVMIVNDTGEKIRLVPPKTRIPDPVEAAGIKAVISSAQGFAAAPKATAMPEVVPSRSAIDGEAEPSDETPGGENATDIPEKPILPGKIPYSNVSVTKSPLTGDAKRAGYAF